jgi:hypothetical protein
MGLPLLWEIARPPKEIFSLGGHIFLMIRRSHEILVKVKK